MNGITLFTPIDYARPRSFAQGTLSILSNYFYLGGKRAVVFKGDEAVLEYGKVSWQKIALKVASYVFFFPLTLALFTINCGLRYQHRFTVIALSRKNPLDKLPEELIL